MSDTLPPVPPGSTIRQNADGSWSYRVGPHAWRPMSAPQTAPSIPDGWKALERTQDPHQWPAIDPGQEAAAHAVGRELRRPDV